MPDKGKSKAKVVFTEFPATPAILLVSRAVSVDTILQNRMMCDAWVVRARALRAAADAAPTRATQFLKPVLGVEVRSVA